MKTHEEIEAKILELIHDLPSGRYDSSCVKHIISCLHALDKLIHEEGVNCQYCIIDAVKYVTEDKYRIF
jgi:hypothetical protein